MSAEALLISAVVEEGAGAMRQVYGQGISANSFAVYDEEFKWIERRMARRKPITKRALMDQFGDFQFMRSRGETIADLARELKEEVALAEMNQIIATLAQDATKDNVLELLIAARERISMVTRAHAPMSDVDLDDWRPVVEQMRQRMLLAAQGIPSGLQTGINFIDHHLGGFMPGQFIQINGRTGSAKSYFTTLLGWNPRKTGSKVGVFSPELNDHEVRCRYHTIASADKQVQKEVGIERSFRNRALMLGTGFNIKSYQKLLEYIDSLPGRMYLLCGAGMKDQMSVGYIEDRIVEHELDLVVVDPIYLLKPVRSHPDGNPYQEVAWIAEALHRLGEQYNVPIVFTNQAHLDGNKGDAPSMDKSYGSKTLLHLADYVLAVQHMSEEHQLIVKSTKSRFGEGSWRFLAEFYPNTGLFNVTTPLMGSYMNGSHDEQAVEVVRKAVVKGRATKGAA